MYANSGTIVTITRRRDRRGRRTHEPGEEDRADIKRPPGSDIPKLDRDDPDAPTIPDPHASVSHLRARGCRVRAAAYRTGWIAYDRRSCFSEP
jgi:hypothetical protein